MMLVVADLHLSNRPQDRYRFDFLRWCASQSSNVIICGDLCDDKNRHDAEFTNYLVDLLGNLRSNFYIIAGNHDRIGNNTPFFSFLNYLPNVSFYSNPCGETVEGYDCLFLPFTPTPDDVWADYDFSEYDLIFCHQPFTGAKNEQGISTDGYSEDIFAAATGIVLAGDIHVPQQLNYVEYVGAPYPVRFGDNYRPRVLKVENDEIVDVEPPRQPKKHKVEVTSPDDLKKAVDLCQGDMCKVQLSLDRDDLPNWQTYRGQINELAESLGVDLHGVEIEVDEDKSQQKTDTKSMQSLDYSQVYNAFVEEQGLDDFTIEVGKSLL